MLKERMQQDASESLEEQSASARIQWANEQFSNGLVMSTSFGVQSAVMLHLVTQQLPTIPVIFIDTGYLFPETYRFAEELTERLSLNIQVYKASMSPQEQEANYGKLWEQGLEGLERYNKINKVEPMNRAITELNATAWISGLRRSQAKSRNDLPVISKQNKITKIYPIIDWDDQTIYHYLSENNLPYHPLWEQGYVSVGDWHSTSPLKPDMTPEETRFNGLKRECGLHISTGANDYQI
jgi:phosphoadenosine phosphosulfate reductase